VHIAAGPEKAFPLGLAYLAAAAGKAGIAVQGLDLHEDGEDRLFGSIQRPSLRWVGFSAFTRTWPRVAELTKRVKAARQEITIIVGGPHVTCLPEQAMAESGADIMVTGEGEGALVDIITLSPDELLDHVAGILFRNGRNTVRTEPRRNSLPIDSIAFPDREFLPVRNYGYAMMARSYPYAALVTSRGCTASCTYCPSASLWGGKWRGRSPENILQEMEGVYARYGIRHFIIEDDQFLACEERTSGLCALLEKAATDFTWELSNGIPAEQLSMEQIPVLARAGCTSLTLGLETCCLDEQALGRRPYDRQQARRLIKRCHDVGIFVGGYFLMGFPGETPGQVRANIRAARKLPLDSAHFSILEPLPGTRLFNNRERFLRERPGQTELNKFQKQAYLSFYLRPRVWFHIFAALIRNPRLILILAQKLRDIFLPLKRKK